MLLDLIILALFSSFPPLLFVKQVSAAFVQLIEVRPSFLEVTSCCVILALFNCLCATCILLCQQQGIGKNWINPASHSIMHLTVYMYLHIHMYAHTHTCIRSYSMFHVSYISMIIVFFIVIPYPYCTFKWLLPGTAATFEECNWIHVASQQGHRWRSGSWSLRILVSSNKWHILIECFHH